MDRSHVAENASELARLRSVLAGLTEADLAADLGGGWSVATALAHMAFWDLRAALLLRRWKAGGVTPSPVDTDAVNDSLLPLLQAVPGREASRLALAAAESADREVSELSASLVEAVAAMAPAFRLRRAQHRREHLDQIEAALGRPSPGRR